MSSQFNTRQRVTAHLGMLTEMEDVFERLFPELDNSQRHTRKILTLIYQAFDSGSTMSIGEFHEVLKSELHVSQTLVEERLKRLIGDKLIETVGSTVDRRKFSLKLTIDAWERMQLVGDHIAACTLHYSDLVKARGPIPDDLSSDEFFDPRPAKKRDEQ